MSIDRLVFDVGADIVRTMIDCVDSDIDICDMVPSTSVVISPGGYITFTVDTSIYSEKVQEYLDSIDTTSVVSIERYREDVCLKF